MKTPKRDIFKLSPETRAKLLFKDGTERNVLARWKRKNRISQLKRSLSKLKNGEHFPPSYERFCCQLLNSMSMPLDNATSEEWAIYKACLESIHAHIGFAIHGAEKMANGCVAKKSTRLELARKLDRQLTEAVETFEELYASTHEYQLLETAMDINTYLKASASDVETLLDEIENLETKNNEQ